MHLPTIARAVGLIFAALATSMSAAPKKVSFSQPQPAVEAYDYLEVVAQIEGADAANPFTDATLSGSFGKAGGSERIQVEGFCDADDGSVYRIRFMPAAAGSGFIDRHPRD